MLDPTYFYRLNRSFIAHLESGGRSAYFFLWSIDLKTSMAEQVLVTRERAQGLKDRMGR